MASETQNTQEDSEGARKRSARHRRLLLHISYPGKERKLGRVITPVGSSVTHISDAQGMMTQHQDELGTSW